MPEELISKQVATSLISAGVLRSTYIFKWVSASYSCMGKRRCIFLCWFLFLLTLGHWWGRGQGSTQLNGELDLELWLLPLTLVLQSHDFILTKIMQKEWSSFTKTSCFYTCCFPHPTDPLAAVSWYPLRGHWSLHGQRRGGGSPEDQSSQQQWARRAVGFGALVEMRNWFGGLPVYSQLFPLCLFPRTSWWSLCDSSGISKSVNDLWTVTSSSKFWMDLFNF